MTERDKKFVAKPAPQRKLVDEEQAWDEFVYDFVSGYGRPYFEKLARSLRIAFDAGFKSGGER